MNRRRTRQSGLTRLLDALEWDILAAPADEIRDALDKTEQAQDVTCQEVRFLLSKAVVASKEDSTVTTPPKNRIKTSLHKH